jgi:DNA-binding MarR family transcriptional regulator
MPNTTGARRALLDELRDLLKAVRVFKQQASPTAVPAGMVGVLATIDTMATSRHRAGQADPTDPARHTADAAQRTTAAPAQRTADTGLRTGCHGKDLAAHHALDPSTVSRSVAALVRLGLVRRLADPADGRASLLALTASGRTALDETHRWYDELLAGALHEWTPRELADFAAMLHRFSTDVLSHADPRTADSTTTHTLEAAR